MTFFVVLHALAALLAPLIMRIGRRGFLLLALVPTFAFIWVATKLPDIYAGNYPLETLTWIPHLGLNFTFRLDVLSAIMALLVSGVGALVLIYCSPYFARHAAALGRFGAVFVAFAGAMFGLVTTDNTIALYVFWEATTVFSFLLIGHHYERQASRRAAHQAIILTTAGGLAMLAGLVILAVVPGGSTSISALVQAASSGMLAPDQPVVLGVAIALLLFGAVSKSALVPTHFWLPAAMAAPTPVSAYLHAAAMVKAGVYLVARFAPAFAATAVWQILVLGLGLTTMIVGGYRALRQYDIKLLLAFGTISQLGMIIAIVGYGTPALMLAGLAMIVAHALFKSALFLTVGVIDWSFGTRDLRELSGLGRRLPYLAGAAAIATASMIGLPPLLGYVAKEAALEGLVTQAATGSPRDIAALVAFTAGSILTFAYGLRFYWGAFATKPGVNTPAGHATQALIQTPPILLAVLALIGLVPSVLEAALAPIVQPTAANPLRAPGGENGAVTAASGGLLTDTGHLTLWGGLGWPLAITALVIVCGIVLFAARTQVAALQRRFAFLPDPEHSFRSAEQAMESFAATITSYTQRGSLPFYLSAILLTVMGGILGAILVRAPHIGAVRGYDHIAQIPVAMVTIIAALTAARARRRLKAVLLLGVSGYGVALIYALHGAPDLALTQVMVETVTLVVFILVLRRLPAYFSNRPLRASRYFRGAVAAFSGIVVAILGLLATSARTQAPVSQNFPAEALSFGYGRNIVNVTLVDIRAWDTFGEISVVLVAATGVASLLFLRSRTGIVDRARNVRDEQTAAVWDTAALDRATALHEANRRAAATRAAEAKERGQYLRQPGRGRTWLDGAITLSPRRRSVIFEVGSRLVFYTMILLSLYLLFAGHNQPGGGFAGGLMAGTALIVRYLAGGRYELGEALPFHAGHILGFGLALAAFAGLLPLVFGGTILQTTVFDFTLPLWGDVHLASALLFDCGVYVLVIGLVLDILRSLGAEIDRHGEMEGADDGEGGETVTALIEDDAEHAEEIPAEDDPDFEPVREGR